MPDTLTSSGETEKAFAEYDRQVISNNVIVGCLIGIVFMPVGTVLDYEVYKPEVLYFLKLRLFCSFLISIFWAIVIAPLAGSIRANSGFCSPCSRPFSFRG